MTGRAIWCLCGLLLVLAGVEPVSAIAQPAPRPLQHSRSSPVPPSRPGAESTEGTRGFQELVALRNFWNHHLSLRADDDKANRRFQNEGDVYAGHCGHRSPTSDRDWTKVRDGVVREVTNAMETISRHVSELARIVG